MNIKAKFKEKFGYDSAVFSSAPGRLEILGNHTDYNNGLTLACTVGYKMEFAISPTTDNICEIYDIKNDLTESFNIKDDLESKTGCWIDFYKGMIIEFKKQGILIPGFKAVLYSSIPQGGGMSSSAALLVSAALCFSKLFVADPLSKEQIMLMAQSVEHNFIGVRTGLLDYMTLLFGKKDEIILCDFNNNKITEYIPFNTEFVFLVADSGVKHALVDSAYNIRRQLCEKTVSIISSYVDNVKSLRDVSVDMLIDFREKLGRECFKKSLHVIEEINRVKQAVKYLNNNDYNSFGQLLYQSHQSSIENFDNSCTELNCLIELSKSIPNCLGARLSGGGFGGVTIHLLSKNKVEEYDERLRTAYKHQTGKTLKTFLDQKL
jgi:galactokinase